MLVEFRIGSMRRSPLGKHRARGVDTLNRPRFECHPGSMGGYFKGSWDQSDVGYLQTARKPWTMTIRASSQ
jgi:hypothetical protein